ncbi:GSCOCG00011211001-RA-CDS, partial [Cotesia congregata]
FQGTIWQQVAKQYVGKIVIPYYIYYDEFGVGDPFTPAATLHKMGGLYYSIASLPPKYASTVDNVLLAQLTYYSDYKEFKNAKCFCRLISELKHLATKGIEIKFNNKVVPIYFVLFGVLGDNLAANSLLGFSQSFSSNYFCRFCRASKEDTKILCVENEQLIRNKNNYDEDVKSQSYGIKEECVFNSIPHFNNTLNLTCDILHDFYLSICRYDMAKIIKYLIDEEFITLEDLNDRLRYFDYTEVDHGNKISFISEKHISQGYIIITGAEMSSLVTYFGIIFGDCVPEKDPVWEFYLLLFDLINLV